MRLWWIMVGWAVLGVLGAVGAEPKASPTQLIPPWASWSYFSVWSSPPPEGWERPGYEDSAWPRGMAGLSVGHFGYEQTATSLPMWSGGTAMRGLAMRREFLMPDPEAVGALLLRLEFEDGLMVWINGVEVLRRGFSFEGPVSWDAVPTLHSSLEPEVLDLTHRRDVWRPGTNVLAIQVWDASPGSATLFAWPELRMNFARGPLVQEVLSSSAVVSWQVPAGAFTWMEWQEAGSTIVWTNLSTAPGPQHAIRLTDLRAGTTHRYRIGAELSGRRVWSEFADFSTLRSSGDVSFLVLGDTGSGSDEQYAVAAMMQEQSVDLVLHTGDIVYPAFTAGRSDLRCFSVYETQMRSVPWYFTFGNHDTYAGEAGYLDAFWMPTNRETGTEHFYSFDHGDVHFASLFVPWYGLSRLAEVAADGSRSPHYRWLTNDLASTRKPWKVVFFHQPPRTSGPHSYDDYDLDGRRDIQQMQESLSPLLASLGVDLVLNGHDHNWERYAPVDGVHYVVTGGGGAVPYGVYQRLAGSARQVSVHHATKVQVRGHVLRVEALDAAGSVFDAFTIGRRDPRPALLSATWQEALLPEPGRSNGDGNVTGERFDLTGSGCPSVGGRRANLGSLIVNEDRDFVHVGLRDVMIWPDQTVALWIGSPRRSGVTNLAGVGSRIGHPLGGAPVDFETFRPAWVCLLGDEWVDSTQPGYRRPGSTVTLGQGVFRLDDALTPVTAAHVRQFNRSPEGQPDFDEQNADFMVVSLPRSELGPVLPGDDLWIAALVFSGSDAPAGPGLTWDTAYLGGGLRGSGDGRVAVLPLRVRLGLPPDGDEDLDGLSREQEGLLGTDPLRPDTDADGLPDGWEVAHGLSALDATGSQGGEGDPDGDGYTNIEEFRSDTDPQDARSTLVVSAESRSESLTLRWRAMVGRLYAVEVAERLPGQFGALPLAGFPRRAETTNEVVVVPRGGPGAAERWYRVRELGE